MTFARDPRAGATAIKIEEVGWSERETHRRERKALLFLSLPAPRVTGAHPSPSPPGHTHSCRQPARSEEAVGGAEAWAPPQPSHPCAASACQRSCTGGRGGGHRGPLPPRSPGSGIHFPVSRAPAAAPAPPRPPALLPALPQDHPTRSSKKQEAQGAAAGSHTFPACPPCQQTLSV